MSSILIYGANGYTGELIVRYAAQQGLRPVIAGRNADALKKLSNKYNFPYQVVALDEADKLDAVLRNVSVVVHCAGPFVLTSRAMLEACLRTETHYLDITGEIDVFEACARADDRAKQAGIMVMPGVGFDVVPSDCLALHLKKRLPSSTHLMLAFAGLGGGISHGTRATMTMNAGRGGAIRRDGKIIKVPAAWKTRDIDFGSIQRTAVTIPWGDVSTAFYTTGIPNIEVYTVVPKSAIKGLKMTRYIGKLLDTGLVQKMLQKRIPAGGPSDDQRSKGKSLLWGMASDGNGLEVQSRLVGPEGYTLTALTALNIAQKVAYGQLSTGFQTPAKAYGENLILEIEGTAYDDI